MVGRVVVVLRKVPAVGRCAVAAVVVVVQVVKRSPVRPRTQVGLHLVEEHLLGGLLIGRL